MDSFYCLVRIILNKQLSLYCFDVNNNVSSKKQCRVMLHPVCFTAKSADQVIYLLSLCRISSFFSVQHIAYISIELYKAELAMKLDQIYIQN